jgi:hypothetical protein
MARKVIDGPVKNKKRTKAKVITALGKILKKDGFCGLRNINANGTCPVTCRFNSNIR